MAREFRRPKTGYDVLRRRFAEGRDPSASIEPPASPLSVEVDRGAPSVVREAPPVAEAPPDAPQSPDEAAEGAPAVVHEPPPVAEAPPDTAQLSDAAPPEAAAPVAPEPAAPRAEVRRAGESVPNKGASPRRASIKFNLSAPAPGTFSLYDQAAAAMGHRKALPALIAKAFEALEAELSAGEPLTHMDYPIATAAHRTSSSRMMDADLLAEARRALDPFALLTPTAFGSLLAATALARLLRRRSATVALGNARRT